MKIKKLVVVKMAVAVVVFGLVSYWPWKGIPGNSWRLLEFFQRSDSLPGCAINSESKET